MRRLKIAISFIFIMCIVFTAEAQNTDTVKAKTTWISKINMPKFSMPKVAMPKVNFPKVTMPKVNIPKFSLFSPKPKTAVDSTPVKTIVQVDTAAKMPKVSWTSKIKFPSIRLPKKAVDSMPVKTIVQVDTAAKMPKVSWTSKIKFPSIRLPKKAVDSTALAVKLVETPIAKVAMDTTPVKKIVQLDTVAKMPKASWTSKIKFPSIRLPKKQVDSVKLKVENDSTKHYAKVKASNKPKVKSIIEADTTAKANAHHSKLFSTEISNSINKFSKAHTISLLAGANFSKQTIASGGYKSDFNYNLLDINNDVYKTGFFGGVRFDGKYQNKHEYSLSVSLNKINTGVKYTETLKLTPVIGGFTSFKGEDQFVVMNIAAHYKKQIPIGDSSKYKFYAIVGPSVDARISGTSLENQVTAAYKRLFFKGDIGIEFNNRSMYTMFLHYHHNIGSLTKSPVNTNISSFEFGVIAKAVDLF